MAQIVVFIQSRVTSTRLPNKVNMPLSNDKTVLEMCKERCKAANYPVYVVTPWNQGGDLEGPEANVLQRYVLSGHKLGLFPDDIIVRVTADCPLVDPRVIHEMVELFRQSEGIDYVSSSPRWDNAPNSYPHGTDVEVVRFGTLDRLSHDLHMKDPRREHVTQALYKGPVVIDVTMLGPAAIQKDYSHIDYSINTSLDYALVDEITREGISPGETPFSIADRFQEKLERMIDDDK